MTKEVPIPTANTTLLDLLNMGARITFGSGRSLKGDLDGRYVAVSNEFGSLGLWDMDAASGVQDAVHDLVRDARESGLDLHGAELATDEDEEPVDDLDEEQSEGGRHAG